MNLEEELDQAEKNLKLLRDGIPLKDENGELVGWMEKPDRAANQFFLEEKGTRRGYGKKEKPAETNTKWYENISEEEETIIINFGAFGYSASKISNIINKPSSEIQKLLNNKESEFRKLYYKGKDTADYIIDLKIFEKAQSGDMKAIEEFEERRNND